MEAKEVVKNLIDLYREKKLAHAYLIETNNITKCYEDIKVIIKNINCFHEYKENCSECNLCHLIDENTLPSFITIEPDGKNIKKESIEFLKNAFSKVPIYTENNIYVIKYAEKMNGTAFNKMLKFLEEPESNIIGFFLTENKENVANTIVSRCGLLKMIYSTNKNSDLLGIDNDQYQSLESLVKDYIKKIDNNDEDLVWYNTSVLSKELTNRNEITIFLKILFDQYKSQLIDNLSKQREIYQKIKIILKYLEQLNYNVNTNLLLDSLVIELGEVYGK